MFNHESILNSLSKNLLQIQQFKVKKISFLGSFVKGEQTQDSELDIVINFEKGERPLITI